MVDSNGFSYYSPVAAAPSKAAKAPKDAAKPKAAAVAEKAPVETSALEAIILGYLDKNGEIPNTEDFCNSEKLSKEDMEPVLKSLLVDDYLGLEVIEKKLIELTDEGNSYAQEGSPEYQFVTKMKMGEKCDMAEMENRCGKQVAKVGFGKAMKQKWVKKEGDKFERIVEIIVDEDQSKLQSFLKNPLLEAHEKKDVDNYKKRKHLNVKSLKSYKVTKGGSFAPIR